MAEFTIRTATSEQSEKGVQALLNGGFMACKAEIHYNPSKGTPSVDSEEEYPLVLYGYFFNSFSTIKVNSLTAGYGGTGPNAMVRVLKAAGFVFDEDDILTKDRMNFLGDIHLVYNTKQ